MSSLWVNDGFCDDLTNNENCQFDGGDCCLDIIQAEYCDECICNETGLKHEEASSNFDAISCYTDYIGDLYCDDQNNVEECQFDGGDCCLEVINDDYCIECICKN